MHAKRFLYLLVLPIRLAAAMHISTAASASINNSPQNGNDGTSVLVPDLAVVNLALAGLPVILTNNKTLNGMTVPGVDKADPWMWLLGM